MQTFTTSTGLGYIREDATGHIISKCEVPSVKKLPDTTDKKGKVLQGAVVPVAHPIKDGFTFVEAPDRAAFDAVVVYQPSPPPKTPEEVWEEKVWAEVRAMAEERLAIRGEVPPKKGGPA